MVSNEYLVTVPVTIISLIITILITGIVIYLLCHFYTQRNIHSDNEEHSSISKYYRLTAANIMIFSALNSFFTSLYCLYFLWDPMYDDKTIYIQHPSHIQRITSTISWYIAKVSLIWFFNGRLYYAFKGSIYSFNRSHMQCINVSNIIFATISVLLAYYYTYTRNQLLAEFSFNLWRIQYQVVILTVLYMFTKRLLCLNAEHECIKMIAAKESEENEENDPNSKHDTHNSSNDDKLSFLMIITRYATLTLTLSFSTGVVAFCWFGSRFLFGKATRLRLLIPMMMATLDSLITAICILCLFHIGDKLYYKLCGFCDKRCYQFSRKISLRLLHKSVTNKNGGTLSVTPELKVRVASNTKDVASDCETIDIVIDEDTDIDGEMKKETLSIEVTNVKTPKSPSASKSKTDFMDNASFEFTRSNSVHAHPTFRRTNSLVFDDIV